MTRDIPYEQLWIDMTRRIRVTSSQSLPQREVPVKRINRFGKVTMLFFLRKKK